MVKSLILKSLKVLTGVKTVNDNELYNGEFNEKDIVANNEEENYNSAYWLYIGEDNGD